MSSDLMRRQTNWATVMQLCAYAHRARLFIVDKSRRDNQRADGHRDEFYRKVWGEAADAIGAGCRVVSNNLCEIVMDDRRVRVSRNYTPLDDPVTLQVAGNKPLVNEILRSHGIPTPDHLVYTLATLANANVMLKRYGRVVIKPANATAAGRGITTGISTPWQLRSASIRAAAFRNQLLVEQQLDGDNYRILVLDGHVLDVVQRRAPAVLGDGRSSVRHLVAQETAHRLQQGYSAAQVVIRPDLEMKLTLANQGLTLRSIPENGKQVRLKTVVNDNDASRNIAMNGRVNDAVLDSCCTAARLVGVRLAGVDIITPDIRRPLEEVGGKVLEVNTTPGFYYHYHRQGEPVPIAELILRRCFESITIRDGTRPLKVAAMSPGGSAG